MLREVGAEIVMPPGYRFCGYPQTAAGLYDRGRLIIIENRMLFHRIAITLNYMDIKTVLVSCGTCMDQLLQYQFEKIFPACRLLDIHEYMMERDVVLDGAQGTEYLFHDLSHTPIQHYNQRQVASILTGKSVLLSDCRYGEADTLGTSRPDITNQLRFRKSEELNKDIDVLVKKTA
ncbi:MAG: hypothetical protein ABW118_11550 [Candidatus Thiodiazotropha sp.]